MGFAGGDGLVGGVDAAVEVVGLALEAVLVSALLGGVAVVAAAGSAEGVFEAGQEEDGQVGLEVVADGRMHSEDAVAAELAAGALVGLG